MPTPNQSSAFPTFLQYWKNLIHPKRRVVPIMPPKQNGSGKKKSAKSAEFFYEGTLSVSPTGSYAVEDKEFAIDSDTLVFGDLKVGTKAEVICTVEGLRRRAVKITLSA